MTLISTASLQQIQDLVLFAGFHSHSNGRAWYNINGRAWFTWFTFHSHSSGRAWFTMVYYGLLDLL